MTDDTKLEIENYRNTFKARAKGKVKTWYIEGNTASSFDTVADQFREEAEILFSGDALDKHLQYVELLVNAAEKAAKESSVDPTDSDVLFTHDPDVSSDDLQQDGDRFERAIDDMREHRRE